MSLGERPKATRLKKFNDISLQTSLQIFYNNKILKMKKVSLKICGITNSQSVKTAYKNKIRSLGFASNNLNGPNTATDKKIQILIKECKNYKIESVLLTRFVSLDKLIKQKLNYNYKFDIRFHLEPDVKLMKTQDNKSILIELDDEGWKFTCNNYDIGIDNGLFFGNKNSYSENQNIFISGISNNQIENIRWEIKKI